MRAVVSHPDTHALGIQEDVESVQSCEAGRVGQTGGVEEGREECLESRACGGGVAGVDVGVEGLGSLRVCISYCLAGLWRDSLDFRFRWCERQEGSTFKSFARIKSSGLGA